MNKPKLLIFASGSEDGGGSGFRELVFASQNGILDADIVGVGSNYPKGGVYKYATKLGIKFTYFPKPWSAEEYQRIAQESGADFFALSGWLRKVVGLDPNTTFNSKTVFNIHPGPLPGFGGKGMWGHHVHEVIFKAFQRGEITQSAASMHFLDFEDEDPEVEPEYDTGPVFFRGWVDLKKGDTADDIGDRVNEAEHRHQARITNMVVNGLIYWDGVNHDSLVVPEEYSIDQTA